MRKSIKRSTFAAGVIAATSALLLAGCTVPTQDEPAQGSSNLDPDNLKMALFYTEGNDYLTAGIASAKATAEDLGIELDVFDAQFDTQTQVNQIQSAITRGGYDVFIMSPNDGQLLCDVVKNNVFPEGIEVVTFNGPICGRDLNSGDDLWEPGTIAHISGQTAEVYQEWVRSIADDNPDGGNVAVLTGPPIQANTVNMTNALEELGSEFTVVANQTTDYTTPQGFAATQTILQANPDLDIIISNYAGITMGVVEAVKAAGKSDDVRVYDFGGNEWALGAVKSGDLRQTVIMLPASETAEAVKAAYAFAQGEDVPRFIDLTKLDFLPGTPFATSENVDEFTPEY